MTSTRPHDANSSFASRRGHANQLSISDPSHHVTEAIGTLYGEDEDEIHDENSRPLSFMPGAAYQEQIHRAPPRLDTQHDDPRRHLIRGVSDQQRQQGYPHERTSDRSTLPLRTASQRSHNIEMNSPVSPISPGPSPLLRDVQVDQSGSQFPLTNIENPNDIAQELSNLQALRRMSMDVGNNINPDLPHMSLSAMPSIAPSGDDDENDPSRLLWVPAKVHPELAPAEFKSFLEKRVKSIKRMSSSGESLLSVEGSGRSPSNLSRNKSTLSHQIASEDGDAADSLGKSVARGHRPELSLDELVKDPTSAVQKFAQESSQPSNGGDSEDKPILPMAPGMGLRRSTRTTYRKGGSLRYGDRAPFSKRIAQRQQEAEGSGSPSPGNAVEMPPGFALNRVRTEPITAGDNSRNMRSFSGQSKVSEDAAGGNIPQNGESRSPGVHQDEISVRKSQEADNLASETQSVMDPYQSYQPEQQHYPARSSSQYHGSQAEIESEPSEPPPRSSRRNAAPLSSPSTDYGNGSPQNPKQMQFTSKPVTTHASPNSLSDTLGSHSSPLPGGGASSTDTLTFIPTLSMDDRKPDKKSRKDKDEEASSTTSSRGWKWFKSDDKKKEEGKKSKSKNSVDRSQDNARLDVIQTSIESSAPRGRESLVLERDYSDDKLQEERKKESNRRGDSKRDRDGSLFSSIFGGKKKEEKEKSTKKIQRLQVPEEIISKPLEPDVDYHWTRFPLLEERAIYRMAHIKLANPRRPLISQVLLSNFMYSYLAIVQAMHPQMNVPTSPQQKRLEEEARRKQQEEEYRQRMGMDDSQSLEQYDFDYHRAAVQYAEQGSHEQTDYVDEAQIYQDEHWDEHQEEYDYDGANSYEQDTKDYYQQYDNDADRRHDGRGDMW